VVVVTAPDSELEELLDELELEDELELDTNG